MADKKRIQVTPVILRELTALFAKYSDECFQKEITASLRTKESKQILNLSLRILDLYEMKKTRTSEEKRAINKTCDEMVKEIENINNILIFPPDLIISKNVEYHT